MELQYSYQYQDYITNECIFRYDNAKHHIEMKTFPHHKHIGESEIVIETEEVSLHNVIGEIGREIIQRFHK